MTIFTFKVSPRMCIWTRWSQKHAAKTHIVCMHTCKPYVYTYARTHTYMHTYVRVYIHKRIWHITLLWDDCLRSSAAMAVGALSLYVMRVTHTLKDKDMSMCFIHDTHVDIGKGFYLYNPFWIFWHGFQRDAYPPGHTGWRLVYSWKNKGEKLFHMTSKNNFSEDKGDKCSILTPKNSKGWWQWYEINKPGWLCSCFPVVSLHFLRRTLLARMTIWSSYPAPES